MQFNAHEDADELELPEAAIARGAPPDTDPDAYMMDPEWSETEHAPVRFGWAPALLILLAIGWTAFFTYAQMSTLSGMPSPERISALLALWSGPPILIALVWLLVMRTSHRQARRFADVSLSMQRAGDALETRMQAVNNEISLARDFLAEQARELDMLGRTRARDIQSAAEAIEQAFMNSTEQATALDTVSRSANGNLERLRNHLPVVTSTAKDVTNQIGAAGSAAQEQIDALVGKTDRLRSAGADMGEAIEALGYRADEVTDLVDARTKQSQDALDEFLARAGASATELSDALHRTIADMLTSLDDSADRQRRLAIESAQALRAQLDHLDQAIADVGNRGGEQGDRIIRLAREIDESADHARKRIEQMDETGSEATARIAFAISTALENSKMLADQVGSHDTALAHVADRLETIQDQLLQIAGIGDDRLHPSIERLADRISASREQTGLLGQQIAALDTQSGTLHDRTGSFSDLLERQRSLIAALLVDSGAAFEERLEDSSALERALMEARGALQMLVEDVDAKLSASVDQVRDRSIEAADHARSALDGVVQTSAAALQERTSALLGSVLEQELDRGAERWDTLVSDALHRSDETTELLEARFAKLEQMTANLEVRLERAYEQFEGIDDDAFARRMLLLTESLNSTSIDVAKLLSNEVTDTAWAAYLKGDRGVFTRRAVRLLDAGEVRIIAHHYEEDAEFRDQVNRYIHDFESIMRTLMSTRDGSAISVTLLSSDVGKLYVALAQAIERLRT